MADKAITNVDINEIYDLREVIGKGAFSQVKKCIHRSSGMEFAVKVIDLRKVPPNEKTKIKREAQICLMLDHPNIVKLHEVYETSHTYYMIFELVSGGELFEDIVRRTFYSERDASHLMLQILNAIHHIHQKDIVHRDLKPENLLLESQRDGADIKLTDFGLAVLTSKGQNEWFGFAGTPGYLSPEVVRRVPYGKPADMWACGVILYILLAGYPPFWDDDTKELYEQIKLGEYEYPSPDWDDVSTEAKHLIDHLLVLDPAQRLTIDDALAHPWIAQSDRVAPHVHRQGTIEEMKRFNARQKFKGAIFTAIATSKLMFGSKSVLDAAKLSAAQNGSSPAGNVENVTTVVEADSASEKSTGKSKPVLETSETLLSTSSSSSKPNGEQEEELLQLTHKLLESIQSHDYDRYSHLCDPQLTAFEPEALGTLVEGMSFHKFYFDAAKAQLDFEGPGIAAPTRFTIANPKIKLLAAGSVGIVAYTRITQSYDPTGRPITVRHEETRVWERQDGSWKHVHFHRT